MLVLLAACGFDEPAPRGVLVVVNRAPFSATLGRPRQAGFASSIASELRARLPDLCESIVAGDGRRTQTMTLRPGLRFASGRPITVEDAIASLRAQPVAPDMTVERLDDRRLRLRLPAPRADVRPRLTWVEVGRADQVDTPGAVPLPIDAIDASGAWMVARIRDPDVVLVPNPHALHRPGLDAIVHRAAGNQRNALAAAIAGEADHVQLNPGVRDDELIREFSSLRLLEAERRRIGALRMNCKSPRLSDARVRRALNLAVDRAPILERFVSRDARATAGLGPPRPAPLDQARAAALLDDAGWRVGSDGIRAREGERMDLLILVPDFFSETPDLIQALAADLRLLGIASRIEVGAARAIQLRRAAGDFDLTFTWYLLTPGKEHEVIVFFRPTGDAVGPRAGGWDFGGCSPPLAASIDEVDHADPGPALDAALAGFYETAKQFPPALFIFELTSSEALHERFEVAPGESGQTLFERVRLAGEPLPRDRLSYWLESQP